MYLFDYSAGFTVSVVNGNELDWYEILRKITQYTHFQKEEEREGESSKKRKE